MREFKFWLLGLILIAVFFVLSEFSNSIGKYQFTRIGLNLNYLLVLLWSLPSVATFLACRYSPNWIGFPGLTYLILIPTFAAIINEIKGVLGIPVDFPGVRGVVLVFNIYFLCALIPVGIGFILGAIFRERM